MKLTNRYNLPQPFVDAVSYDDYDPGDSDYTTTSLLQPPRITRLMRDNWATLEEDASDRVWKLSGTAKHVILQRIALQNPDRYIVEKRYYIQIGPFRISGQLDLFDKKENHLYDWKETSVWKLMLGDSGDWEAQGNVNRYICAAASGIQFGRLTNIAFVRDWKLRQSMFKKGYPQVAIKAIPLQIWTGSRALQFIQERINIHEAAKQGLPLCTAEDRWADPPKWALMKNKRKRAVKLYDDEGRANAALLNAGDKDHYVEFRPTEQTRCEFYCPVSKICSQFAALKKENHEETQGQNH